MTRRTTLVATVGIGLAVIFAARAQAPSTYTLDDLGHTHDETPGDDVCADSDGHCTLRAAVEEATAHGGATTILPGSLTGEIRVNEDGCTGPKCFGATVPGLPANLTIDFCSGSHAGLRAGDPYPLPLVVQTEYPSTVFFAVGENVTLRCVSVKGHRHTDPGDEFTGITATAGTTVEHSRIESFQLGILITNGADDAVVRDTVTVDVQNEGILTQGSDHTLIEDNFCGVETDGLTPNPADTYGCITSRSPNTTIQHNLVAGNFTDGIVTETNPDNQVVPTNVSITDNDIGLASNGAPLGNRAHGIHIKQGSGITIDGNVIAASHQRGVQIDDGADVTMGNNNIGTNASGIEAAGYCNQAPQIAGDYTDAGGNIIATSCVARKGCCEVHVENVDLDGEGELPAFTVSCFDPQFTLAGPLATPLDDADCAFLLAQLTIPPEALIGWHESDCALNGSPPAGDLTGGALSGLCGAAGESGDDADLALSPLQLNAAALVPLALH